jgi:peptidoglycan-N-acetylglucosamine deacetylase
VHDGNAATTANGQPVLLSVLPDVFEAAREQGLRFITLRQAFTSD